MKRPYVNLSSENTIQTMLESLNGTLDMFTTLDGVVGVTLNGGLSRGYGDYLSEIDIVISTQQAIYGVQERSLPICVRHNHDWRKFV